MAQVNAPNVCTMLCCANCDSRPLLNVHSRSLATHAENPINIYIKMCGWRFVCRAPGMECSAEELEWAGAWIELIQFGACSYALVLAPPTPLSVTDWQWPLLCGAYCVRHQRVPFPLVRCCSSNITATRSHYTLRGPFMFSSHFVH